MSETSGRLVSLGEVALDSSSVENYQVTDASQGHASAYLPFTHGLLPPPPAMGSKSVSWDSMQRTDGPSENGILSNSVYYHDQQKDPASLRDFQDGLNAAPNASTSSSLGSGSGPHDYSGYASYPSSTDPYGYGNTSYQGYYYGYQQQATHSYSQQVGTYQNSGAPYQPPNSFQNTSPYAGSTTSSYSSTYYNAGDYQSTGGYQSSGYTNQAGVWNDGNYGNYPHHYSSHIPSDANGPHSSSSVAANSVHYQQNYKQWADYYSQTASDVSCAPGTENTAVSTASSVECPIPGVNGATFAISNSQPPPPGTSASWRPDFSSSDMPPLQASAAVADTGWTHGTPGFSNQQHNHMPSYFQKPLDANQLQFDNSEDQQKSVCPQGTNSQFPVTHQVSQSFRSPLQTVSALDARRVSKLQIPTNPRITSTLGLGMPKIDKDSFTADAAPKPAYISVSMPKSNNKVTSHDAADAMLKPGKFPTSLRAYVERALARCKDDSQKVACQEIMKEMITKASLDGTLFTQDWDTEPLFPLPNSTVDPANKDNMQSSEMLPSLPKYKKSPSRRTKSRWEPIAEDKLVEKLASVNHDPVKDATWDRLKERDSMANSGKRESKENSWSNIKFYPSQPQTHPNKNVPRPIKKQRLVDHLNAAENGDTSSDSDKDLTAYYAGAITLANSPDERKKRENRSKRFEKGSENRAEIKQFRPKVVGAGNSITRRTSALLLAKNHEDGYGRAVEDIDWNALTVKGTCQEIEKRYLRLTSAPDPATVRPEEVLERALLMVQNSQKNYLYKCDQLKSIRQDLTVQRIHNELTVKVYETHGRLALEAGDLPEYNQCQSQLKGLYAEGIKGCHMEFAAYNLLCVILHSNNNRDLLSSMARLSPEAKNDDAVKHALAVRAAVTSGNYILFFRLYRTAPNLNTCLMDLYVEKMRFEAVRCMSRSYRPTVPVSFITQVLGFGGVAPTEGNGEKDSDGVEECVEWLRAHGASLTVDNNGELQLDTKVTTSSLYMPDPEDAVAHGDASLAVIDFLTRTS